MHLTQHTDYGLRVLIYAAVNHDALVNIGTIADTYGISKSHLVKVIASLVKGGFLDSVRGKGGGLRLARPAGQINIGSVVRYLEPMQLVECMGGNNQCILSPDCRMADMLSGGIQAFLNHLHRFTLADLINPPTYGLLHAPQPILPAPTEENRTTGKV